MLKYMSEKEVPWVAVKFDHPAAERLRKQFGYEAVDVGLEAGRDIWASVAEGSCWRCGLREVWLEEGVAEGVVAEERAMREVGLRNLLGCVLASKYTTFPHCHMTSPYCHMTSPYCHMTSPYCHMTSPYCHLLDSSDFHLFSFSHSPPLLLSFLYL